MPQNSALPMACEQDWENLRAATLPFLSGSLATKIADPDRCRALNIEAAGIHFDFARTHLCAESIGYLAKFAEAGGLSQWMRAIRDGQIVNPTEDQAACHHLYRLSAGELGRLAAGQKDLAAVIEANARCRKLAGSIRSGQWLSPAGKPFRHLIHLGIGGSALGPKLLVDSLGYGIDSPIKAHFVANIDGHCLEPALKACQPEETLVICCSKTFGTLETLRNAEEVIDWMRQGGVADPLGQFIGVSSRPERAVEFGISEEKVLFFPKTIGGRYSVWSTVGLPAMIMLGVDVFERFLAGARAMDEHFHTEPLAANAPVLAGLLDVWYRHCANLQSVALFCYDQRLELLPFYCQQLYMESNGKDRDRNGRRLGHSSAPVLWGGVGTEVQHAVFQLMHQGTGLHLPDFITVARPAHSMPIQHQHLLANMLAQTSALSKGRREIDGQGEDELDFINASRLFSGDRPSTTIILPALDPERLGALMAHYEHRTYVSGALWGINVFDQMGVELGKEMAQSLFPRLDKGDSGKIDDPALALNLKTLNSLRNG